MLLTRPSYAHVVAQVPISFECADQIVLMSVSTTLPVVSLLSVVTPTDSEIAEGDDFVYGGYQSEHGFTEADISNLKRDDRKLNRAHVMTIQYRLPGSNQLAGQMRFVSTTPVTYDLEKSSHRQRLPFFQKNGDKPGFDQYEALYSKGIEIGRNHTSSSLNPQTRLAVLMLMFRTGLGVLNFLEKIDHTILAEGMAHNSPLFHHIGITLLPTPFFEEGRRLHARDMISLMKMYFQKINHTLFADIPSDDPWWSARSKIPPRVPLASATLPRMAARVEPLSKYWGADPAFRNDQSAATYEDDAFMLRRQLLRDIDQFYDLQTGLGDAGAAVNFLRSLEATERYSPEKLDPRSSSDFRRYYLGLLYALAGKFPEASGEKRMIQANLQLDGCIMPLDAFGRAKLAELDEHFGPIDLLTRETALSQLTELESLRIIYPYWLAAPIHARRSVLLRKMGQGLESQKAETLARELSL